MNHKYNRVKELPKDNDWTKYKFHYKRQLGVDYCTMAIFITYAHRLLGLLK